MDLVFYALTIVLFIGIIVGIAPWFYGFFAEMANWIYEKMKY